MPGSRQGQSALGGMYRATPNEVRAPYIISSIHSIVSELVLNSLDAEADIIEIKIITRTKKGGSLGVSCLDNGRGMSFEDLERVGEWHCSSKDMHSRQTHGFRGEALAAISVLCDVEITSKTPDSIYAYRKTSSGPPIQTSWSGLSSGSLVEANNVFASLPVREKNTSVRDELVKVVESVSRAAMLHHAVTFRVIEVGSFHQQGECLLSLNAAKTVADRFVAIHGATSQKLFPVRVESGGVVVEGLLAPPSLACLQGHRGCQYMYINSRWSGGKDLLSNQLNKWYMEQVLATLAGQSDGKSRGGGGGAIAFPAFVLSLTCQAAHCDFSDEADSPVRFSATVTSSILVCLSLLKERVSGGPATCSKPALTLVLADVLSSKCPSIDSLYESVCSSPTPASHATHASHAFGAAFLPTPESEKKRKRVTPAVAEPVGGRSWGDARRLVLVGEDGVGEGEGGGADGDDREGGARRDVTSRPRLALAVQVSRVPRVPKAQLPSFLDESADSAVPFYSASTNPPAMPFAPVPTGAAMPFAPVPTGAAAGFEQAEQVERVDKLQEPVALAQAQAQAQVQAQAQAVAMAMAKEMPPLTFIKQPAFDQGLPVAFPCPDSQHLSLSHEILSPSLNHMVGQVDRKYLLLKSCWGREMLVIGDQHAMDERQRYEALLQSEKRVITGSRHVSEAVALSRELNETLLDHAAAVESWGFRWKIEEQAGLGEGSGPSSSLCRVSRVPLVMNEPLCAEDLVEFLRQLSVKTGAQSTLPPAVTRLLQSKACRGAIMFGDPISHSVGANLIESLYYRTKLPFQCAHGRPSVVPLTTLDQFCDPEPHKPLYASLSLKKR